MSVVANVALNIDSRGATQSLRAVQQGARATDNAVSGLLKTVGKLAIVLGAIQAVKFVFVKTAELESQTRSLEVLTGSAAKAKQIIEELQQLGAVTPFTSTELIDSAKRLQAFGVEAEKVVQTTKRLADVSGATGAELQGLVTAYGQVQAKGRLQGEELLQFQERGVALQGELQKMYGMSGQELRKALEKGRIGAEAVEVAINRLTEKGGKYADGAIAQSDTLNGRFSTLMDNIEMLAKKIGKVLEPAFKGILNIVVGIVDKISEFLDDPELKAYLEVANKIMDQKNNAGAGADKKTANDKLFNTRAEIKKLTTEIKAAEKAGIGMAKGLEIKGIDNNVIIPSAPVLPIMKAELTDLNKKATELENKLKILNKPKAIKEDVNLKTPALLEDQAKKLALEKQLNDARLNYERQIADFRQSTLLRIADMERTLQDQRVKANFDLQQSNLKLAGQGQFTNQTIDIIKATQAGKSPAEIGLLEAARDSAKSLNDAAVTRRQIEFDSTMKKIQLERTLTDFKKGIEREIGEMQKSYARQTGDILTKAGISIQSAMIKGAEEVEKIMMRIGTGMTPPANPVLPAANSQLVRKANDQPNQQASSAGAGVGMIITPEMTRSRRAATLQRSDPATMAGRQGPLGSRADSVDAANNIKPFSPATAQLDSNTNDLKRQETQAAINQILEQQVTKTNELALATQSVITASESNLVSAQQKNQVDQRTLDLMSSGTNPALAAQFAQNEQLNAQSTTALEKQRFSVIESLKEKDLAVAQISARKELIGTIDEQIAKQPQVLEGLNQQAVKQKEINDASAEFTSKQESIKGLVQGIGASIEGGIVSAIDGAITGAKSLQEVLSDVLKDIGKMLISFGIKSLLGGIDIGGTKIFGGGKAAGGPVSSNSTYMVGEKGPELFVPSTAGTIIPAGPTAGIRDAMANGNNGNGATAPVLNMSFETTRFGNTDYVSREQLEAAMMQTRAEATKAGARRGMTMTLDKLQQSPSTRSRVGLG